MSAVDILGAADYIVGNDTGTGVLTRQMKIHDQPVEIEHLNRINEYGPDDLFICCAGFEDRCIKAVSKMGMAFRTRFSIIFVVEDPFYKQQVETNLFKLQAELGKRTSEGVFVVRCQRDAPTEAINQLRTVWNRCKPKDPDEPCITIDISSFTKIYLLELLHFLVAEQNMGIPRLIHTTQTYAPTRLTRGVEQITTVPNFFGNMSMDKETLLIMFLGFEPERALSVWKHFNPAKVIGIITNPPRDGKEEYLDYAKRNNARLLSLPAVEVRTVPPDDPYAARNALEIIFQEVKDGYNMVIGPFGTKSQTVGVFLFCLEHPKAQVVYSFPSNYTRSYINREPGCTLLLPMAPVFKP